MEFYIRHYKRVYNKDLTTEEAVEIILQNRLTNDISHICGICSESKFQYERDLIRLKDKYGDRILKITNYEERLMKVAKQKK